MPETRQKSKGPRPEWAKPIRELRDKLGLNQLELGRRLHYSAMAVSRWERGELEPSDRAYIELGNLAGNPRCWYFWGRAGLHSENLLRVMPEMRERLQSSRFANLEIVSAGSRALKTHLGRQKLVAIPLLKVVAATHGETGGHPSSLLSGPAESMIAAPKDWCPNPATTSCLRVRGNSMSPLIQDGSIVAADYSQNDQALLNGKIVIAWHRDSGLTVSRLRRFDHTEVLESENHGYGSITLGGKHHWTILAKVLWWIAKAP
jgi:SOS-response transcriptional repressor LexA/DNA-binding XRE family transcriptional regulator